MIKAPCKNAGCFVLLEKHFQSVIKIAHKKEKGVKYIIMKDKTIKIFGTVATATSVFMALGYSFFEITVSCKKQKNLLKKRWSKLSHTQINHPRDKFEKEYEDGKEWCVHQNMQDCYMKSVDGLVLHAYYLPAKDAKRFVLLSHGYRGSSFGDFAYMAKFLHENNCNLLFIDQRCCGLSEGDYITFGAMEQYDVQKWAYYIDKRNKSKLPIYLYGESMGAAAVLMSSGQKLPQEVKGIISDCGFRSMKGQLQDMAANWFHLKWVGLMLFRLDLFCAVLAGFRMKDADTSKAMKINKRPILFFHGEKDTYVDHKNTLHNYSLCQAPKELVIIPEARHLCSVYTAPELYKKKVLDFFEKYD